MKLYNTMTRRKEELDPLKPGEVSVYTCGPTVYSYATIGNMRTYLFMDWFRRCLRFAGYSLKHVMNITDVGHLESDADEGEDKLEKKARESNASPWEIAAHVTEVFFRDHDALNIGRPEIIAKATDHIPEMLEIVEALYDRGYAYEISDGIYFDVSKFPGYGRLSRLNLEEQMAGARVEVNEEKRNPADFALWKKAPPQHIMQWPSRWGQGYPGWHIECSAMARKYLGDTFDIHTGGIDHIPIHHENEIAQSVCFTGQMPAKIWMHTEFMQVDGGKMGKSLGNAYILADVTERGYSPLHLRYLFAQAHYRHKCNFTWEGLAGAKAAYRRLMAALAQHKASKEPADAAVLAGMRSRFAEAVTDDLNIPKALSYAWELARLPQKSKQVYDLVIEMDAVLGLGLDQEPATEDETPILPAEVQALIGSRAQARTSKNWAESDRLRDELKALGYTVEDTKQGQKVSKL
jgi:cysteinyl-tRNA synthetase